MLNRTTAEKMVTDLRNEAYECSKEIARLELHVKQLKLQRRRALLAVPKWESLLKKLP